MSYLVFERKPSDVIRRLIGIYKKGYLYEPQLIKDDEDRHELEYKLSKSRKEITVEELSKYHITKWDGKVPIRIVNIALSFWQ